MILSDQSSSVNRVLMISSKQWNICLLFHDYLSSYDRGHDDFDQKQYNLYITWSLSEI